MAYRDFLASWVLSKARSFGYRLGCELVVEQSDHSLHTSMEVPDKSERAWDPDLFHRGQLYVRGYANPVKASVRQTTSLEEPDTVGVEESDVGEPADDEDDTEDAKKHHVQLISSARYHTYMVQDLISQLLTPREQWRLIVYAVIGLAGLQLISVMILLRLVGVF